jgi:hypothetical protein
MNDFDKDIGEEQWEKTGDDFNIAEGSTLSLRTFFGAMLILVGFLVACWTIYTIYVALQDPGEIPLYKDVASEISEAKLRFDGKDFNAVLAGKFIGALSVFLMLVISTSIAGTLITQGVNLINLDMLRLTRKFDSLKDSINRKLLDLKVIVKRK